MNAPRDSGAATSEELPVQSPLTAAPEALTPGQRNQENKAGIGGCLLYPLFFLVMQPISLLVILTGYSTRRLCPPGYRCRYQIIWPNVALDALIIILTLVLLVLFLRKKAILPALFVAVLGLLFTLATGATMILPNPGGDADPVRSFVVLFVQCFVLMPYFVLSKRVKNTFVAPLDSGSVLDRLVLPVAPLLERFYIWLVGRGKLIFLLVLGFVIIVMAVCSSLGTITGNFNGWI